MGRKPCCEKEGMNRGAWTAMEDKLLANYISINGEGKWRNLPINAGLKRCGKSCRMRWLNYLKPDIKRGNITSEEEDLIIRLHNLLGNRWSLIAGRLPGRTDNEIKNYWNTNIGKKLAQQSHVGHPKEPMVSKLSLPRHNHHQYPLPSTLTCAIRTKATRCTKVIIPKELHDIQQKKDIEVEKKPGETTFNNNESMSTLLMGPQDVFNQDSLWAFDDSKSTAPKIDAELEMDDIIFSKILGAHQFFPYSDFQNHQQQQEQQNDHAMMNSIVMNDNQFFEQDVHGEFDVDWIKSFIHTELMEETS